MIAYNLLGLFNFALHDDDLGPDLQRKKNARGSGKSRFLLAVETRFLTQISRSEASKANGIYIVT